MKYAMITVLFSMTAFQAFAADKSTISITVNQAIDARAALSSLDTYQDTDPAGKQIVKKYKFSVDTRVKIAEDLWALSLVYSAAMAQKNAIVDDADLKPGTAIPAYITAEINKIGEQKQSLEVEALLIDELNLSMNPIPPGVLAALTPLFTGPSAVTSGPFSPNPAHQSDD